MIISHKKYRDVGTHTACLHINFSQLEIMQLGEYLNEINKGRGWEYFIDNHVGYFVRDDTLNSSHRVAICKIDNNICLLFWNDETHEADEYIVDSLDDIGALLSLSE